MLQKDHGSDAVAERTLLRMQQRMRAGARSVPDGPGEHTLADPDVPSELERATLDEIDLLTEVMITAAGAGRTLAAAELDRALGLR